MHHIATALLMLLTLGGYRHHGKPNVLKDGYTVTYTKSVVVTH